MTWALLSYVLIPLIYAIYPSSSSLLLPPSIKNLSGPLSPLLTHWPTSPFNEYIYEPDDYVSVSNSHPFEHLDLRWNRLVISSLSRISNEDFPQTKDLVEFTHFHVIKGPVIFELHAIEGQSATGWNIFQILTVVHDLLKRYCVAAFEGEYVRDSESVADVKLALIGEER